MLDKWIVKYMKLAKTLADDNHACYSRQIGVVLISDDNTPIGFGYNGSISGAPHTDEEIYLAHLWDNLLSEEQRDLLRKKYQIADAKKSQFYKHGEFSITASRQAQCFVNRFSGCKTCPRKLLDLPSGESLELCNCSHAERNAIFNASKRGTSTKGATMYCWCSCPCHECAIAIVQSGIKKVVCLKSDSPDYSKSSRFHFQMTNIELIEVKAEDVLGC